MVRLSSHQGRLTGLLETSYNQFTNNVSATNTLSIKRLFHKEMAGRNAYRPDALILWSSTEKILAGTPEVGIRKEVSSEAERFSHSQQRERLKSWTSETQARGALKRPSDGFELRRLEDFQSRNDGKES